MSWVANFGWMLIRATAPGSGYLPYVRLDLSPDQEDSMVHWNLFPQRSNALWWGRYREAKEAEASLRSPQKCPFASVPHTPSKQPS